MTSQAMIFLQSTAPSNEKRRPSTTTRLTRTERTMTETSGLCNQNIVCILGMHRSGTSLLTRMLNLIDVYLGPEQLLMRPDFANPKGYWEHDEIVSLNDEILRRLGGSWDEPPTFPPGWENAPAIDDLKQRGRRLIQDSFANVETWGWKDPRSCLTLPFWQQLLPNLRYILCLRNPLDVAGSLESRDGLPTEKSSQLWLTYVSSALEHSDGRSRLVIFYEDLINDCLGELQLLADFLGKSERAKSVDVQEAVQEFMEKELQHYHTSLVQATASPRIDVRAKALYIAQKISVGFGRSEGNGQELDHHMEKALDILNQYAIRALGQANPLIEQLVERDDQLAENGNTVRLLQSQLLEQGKDMEAISAQLADKAQAVKMLSQELVKNREMIQALSIQLPEKDKALQLLSEELVKDEDMVRALAKQLSERDKALQIVSSQLGEQNRALQLQLKIADETVDLLAAQLLNTKNQLQQVENTLGWRLLSYYGPIKHRFLLPMYRLLVPIQAKRIKREPLERQTGR